MMVYFIDAATGERVSMTAAEAKDMLSGFECDAHGFEARTKWKDGSTSVSTFLGAGKENPVGTSGFGGTCASTPGERADASGFGSTCASTPGERADAKHLGAGLSNFGGGGDVGNSLGTGLDSVGGADAKHED